MSEERSIDGPRIERAVREVLLAIGEDLGREGLIGTPERVAEAYSHLFSGLDKDPASYLEISFAADSHDVVLLRDLPLASMCGQDARRIRARGACRRALGEIPAIAGIHRGRRYAPPTRSDLPDCVSVPLRIALTKYGVRASCPEVGQGPITLRPPGLFLLWSSWLRQCAGQPVRRAPCTGAPRRSDLHLSP